MSNSMISVSDYLRSWLEFMSSEYVISFLCLAFGLVLLIVALGVLKLLINRR